MRNFKSILTSIVTLALALTLAISVLAPVSADAATKRKTVVSTNSAVKGEYQTIKKTGYYTISSQGYRTNLWSFKAPKAGIYYFKVNNLRVEGGSNESSYCEMDFWVGKAVESSVENYGIDGIEGSQWIRIKSAELINYKEVNYDISFYQTGTKNTTSHGILVSEDMLTMKAWEDKYGTSKYPDMEKAAKLVPSFLKKLGAPQREYTIKYKMKKGETIYFVNRFKANYCVSDTDTVGQYDLKIVCK